MKLELVGIVDRMPGSNAAVDQHVCVLSEIVQSSGHSSKVFLPLCRVKPRLERGFIIDRLLLPWF